MSWRSVEGGVSVLLGKTAKQIVNTGDRLVFVMESGDRYIMDHIQDCCESVWLEEVIGDLDDLVGSPFVEAEEVTSDARSVADLNGSEKMIKEMKTQSLIVGTDWFGGVNKYESDFSETWTFYKLGTAKGFVTLRWYGNSNGYYSESVDFYKEETYD